MLEEEGLYIQPKTTVRDTLAAMGFKIGVPTAVLVDGNYLHTTYKNPPLLFMGNFLTDNLDMKFSQYFLSISNPTMTRKLQEFLSKTAFKPYLRDQTDTRVGMRHDNSVLLATEIMALTFQTLGLIEQLVVISANSDLRFPLQYAKRNRFWNMVGVMRKEEENPSVHSAYDAVVDLDVFMPFLFTQRQEKEFDFNELQGINWEEVD